MQQYLKFSSYIVPFLSYLTIKIIPISIVENTIQRPIFRFCFSLNFVIIKKLKAIKRLETDMSPLRNNEAIFC